MANLTLPPELISLVHHVELNKAGWWDKAIQRLILATIWLLGGNATLDDILEQLSRNFQISLDIGKAKTQIQTLCSSGELVPLPGGRLKISESALANFENDLEETNAIMRMTKDTFIRLMNQHCPSLDPAETWNKFSEHFLLPLVRDMGANTYQLISGSGISLDTRRLETFLRDYPVDIHTPFRTAVTSFLDPKNSPVRSYVLRCLNAYFFVQAGNLTGDTLEALTKLVKLKPSFTVFLDTNFVFSILGLHENPSDEAVLSLTSLITELSGKVAVNLYLLPPTVDEVKRVMGSAERNLRGLRLTPNLAEAALELHQTGITKKFIQESKNARQPISAEDYFGPYLKNLIQILRSKGIEFFNQKIDHYRTDQEVIDDLMARLEFEKNRYKHAAKGYEELEHDMVLWHFVRDKRPTRVESPVEAQYWIVTVDYRFLGFDAFKRRDPGNNIPICIHPTVLIQMLQFWIPRTAQFEEAMLSSMRLPFFFQEFDLSAEKVTIRILEALGRYENIADLPKETVTAILLNDALRQKLLAEPNVEKQVQFVREALIVEHHKTTQKLKEREEEAERLIREVDRSKDTINKYRTEIELQEQKLEETERRLEEDRKARQLMEDKIRKLDQDLHAKMETDEKKKRIRGFITRWLLAPIPVIGVLGAGLAVLLKNLGGLTFWWSAIAVLSLLLIGWMYSIDQIGSRDAALNEWRPFQLFHRFRRFVFVGLGAVLMGVLGNAVWEWLKQKWQ